MSPLRLALFQAHSPASDVQAGLAALRPALRAAGAFGAAALIAPESWLPGYNSDKIAELALPRTGAWQSELAQMCKDAATGLVVGYAERDGDRVYNAALALDATGEEIAHYRKIQLFGPREASLYTAGDAYEIFDFCGQKAALLICYDIEFAPHVAALAQAGVTLILVPTANMHPFTHVMTATVPAMAANHGVSIVYANYCGHEGNLHYAGGSLIVGPHGEVLAQAGEAPALLIADLPNRDLARLSTQLHDFRAVQPR